MRIGKMHRLLRIGGKFVLATIILDITKPIQIAP